MKQVIILSFLIVLIVNCGHKNEPLPNDSSTLERFLQVSGKYSKDYFERNSYSEPPPIEKIRILKKSVEKVGYDYSKSVISDPTMFDSCLYRGVIETAFKENLITEECYLILINNYNEFVKEKVNKSIEDTKYRFTLNVKASSNRFFQVLKESGMSGAEAESKQRHSEFKFWESRGAEKILNPPTETVDSFIELIALDGTAHRYDKMVSESLGMPQHHYFSGESIKDRFGRYLNEFNSLSKVAETLTDFNEAWFYLGYSTEYWDPILKWVNEIVEETVNENQ